MRSRQYLVNRSGSPTRRRGLAARHRSAPSPPSTASLAARPAMATAGPAPCVLSHLVNSRRRRGGPRALCSWQKLSELQSTHEQGASVSSAGHCPDGICERQRGARIAAAGQYVCVSSSGTSARRLSFCLVWALLVVVHDLRRPGGKSPLPWIVNSASPIVLASRVTST